MIPHHTVTSERLIKPFTVLPYLNSHLFIFSALEECMANINICYVSGHIERGEFKPSIKFKYREDNARYSHSLPFHQVRASPVFDAHTVLTPDLLDECLQCNANFIL